MLDWTNNVSVRYGNFYYSPFHMISIFGLLGSTMLLGMHGATIVATRALRLELELDEIEVEGSGTHRAQLFWRWVMGFNANADSITSWAFWFAIPVCGRRRDWPAALGHGDQGLVHLGAVGAYCGAGRRRGRLVAVRSIVARCLRPGLVRQCRRGETIATNSSGRSPAPDPSDWLERHAQCTTSAALRHY